jgi:predicted metalloprotease with PDZ domain
MPRGLSHLALAAAIVGTALSTQAQTAAIPAPRDTPYIGTIRLQVDATDLDRHIFHVKEQLPVKPGPMSLLFPRFLPGTHGPYGEIERLAGLEIMAGGQSLPWLRDTVDPYAFHIDVPAGVALLDLSFQFLSAVSKDTGRVVMTPAMTNLQWNSVLLYPAGHVNTAITVQASVQLPAGWRQASALPVAQQSDGNVAYQPVNLATLVDSPIYAGAYLRKVELDPPGTPNPIVLNVFADRPELLEATDAQWQAHRNLAVQADKLFGARHFRQYDFLLAVSDRLGSIGLEHHESSENGVRPTYFKDWDKRPGGRDLLPHEFVHSWNGKFRRPSDLWTPSYEVPMRDSLLWVYEGQTQFWGRVLAARSGLVTVAQTHDNLANVAAALDARAGRTWRNLQDTTNEGTLGSRGSRKDWGNWQRGVDYYDEATLIWLDADMRIREMSHGTKSMDDFARLFFGVQPGRVQPLLYGFDDVVAALNQVQPYDWKSFLRERLDTHRNGSLLDGLARAGWKLAWAETPSEFVKNDDYEGRSDDYAYSLGLYVKRDGVVDGVLWDSAAFQAGLTRTEQIVAVGGVAYRAERLSAAVTANKDGKKPIELLVRDGDTYRTVRIDYRGGLRYPRLERIADAPERLDALLLAPKP